jgi:hypothetical protein
MHIRSHVVLAMIGFVILVAAASCGQAPDPVEQDGLSAEDAAAVRSNLRFAGVDPIDAPEEFFGQFAEDVHWNFRGIRTDGMEALRALEWCHTISGENTPRQVEGSSDLAYVLGTYRLSLNCGDEEPVNVEGEFVTIHRRERDGSWRISLYLAGQ